MREEVLLPLAGRKVSVVCFARLGPFVRVHFWGGHAHNEDIDVGPDYELAIEGRFTLRVDDQLIDVTYESSPHPACLGLVDKTVARSLASGEGGLRLEFSDGDQMTIPPGEYEAWQLYGGDGSIIVSVAGGGLA